MNSIFFNYKTINEGVVDYYDVSYKYNELYIDQLLGNEIFYWTIN